MGGKGSGRTKGSKNRAGVFLKGDIWYPCRGSLCNGKLHRSSDFPNNYCKDCNKINNKLYREKNFLTYKIKDVHRHSKYREEKNRNKEVYEIDANLEEIVEKKLKEQNNECFYSNTHMTEKVNDPNQWTVDRIDYNKGYVEENIVLCSSSLNILKGRIESVLPEIINLYGYEGAMKILRNICATIHDLMDQKQTKL